MGPQDTTASKSSEPREWVVDGYNVLHAGLLRGEGRERWWNAAERQRLLALAGALARSGPDRVWVVFDGSEAPRERPPGLELVFAPSADEWIRKHVARSEVPERLCVVTRDRKVADRARQKGARVVDPARFLARCRDATPSE